MPVNSVSTMSGMYAKFLLYKSRCLLKLFSLSSATSCRTFRIAYNDFQDHQSLFQKKIASTSHHFSADPLFLSSPSHLRRSSRVGDPSYRPRTAGNLPHIVSVCPSPSPFLSSCHIIHHTSKCSQGVPPSSDPRGRRLQRNNDDVTNRIDVGAFACCCMCEHGYLHSFFFLQTVSTKPTKTDRCRGQKSYGCRLR
jgi:hypothetical protein